MKKLEPCSNCGETEIPFEDFGRGFWRAYCANENCSEEVISRSKKSTRKIWNKQQRQAKPREWKDEIKKSILHLRLTVGDQTWLGCVMPDDIIEIRDRIIPVFQKHLQLRGLEAQPETELRKVRTDNLQLTITVGQLRQRVQELESERDQPLVDVTQVLLENEQLRQSRYQVVEQLSQVVERAEQLASDLMQVIGEIGKA